MTIVEIEWFAEPTLLLAKHWTVIRWWVLLASRVSCDTVCLSSSAVSSNIISLIQAKVSWCLPVTNLRGSPLWDQAFHSILAWGELDADIHSYFASSCSWTWWGPEMETAEGGSEHNILSIVMAGLLDYSELQSPWCSVKILLHCQQNMMCRYSGDASWPWLIRWCWRWGSWPEGSDIGQSPPG